MESNLKISLIGAGFVGGALQQSFEKRGQSITVYDKFKQVGKFEDVLDSDYIFLCLPSLYIEGYGYDLTAIQENCRKLFENNYKGTVILKSTVEPGTTQKLMADFKLKMVYNPEFLTARTAFEDFDGQAHIVLGFDGENPVELLKFYSDLYPNAQISTSTTMEAEAMKIFCNSFYAIKVMIFNEFYFLCQRLGMDYNHIKQMMLDNKWINPMHTIVPGPDGKFAYSGACFPKDTNALNQFMERMGTPHEILEATIRERNKIRKD